MPKPKSNPRPQTFAERLAELIADHGLTRYRLAKMTGLDQAFISRLCAGQQEPSLRNADAIARALGHTVAEWSGLHWPEKDGRK